MSTALETKSLESKSLDTKSIHGEPAFRAWRRLALSQATIVAVIAAAMFLALSIFLNGFLSPANLINLLRNVAVLGMLGIGMATVVIGRGIDLSMVAIMTVSVALLFVLVQAGTPLFAAPSAGCRSRTVVRRTERCADCVCRDPAVDAPRWRSARW